MNEIWKRIDGYNYYRVSNLGNVKSYRLKRERILKAGIDGTGYYTVALSNDTHKAKTFKVHQLVAKAFLNHTPCGYKLVVNHIDHNRLNNNVDNLELVTFRENIRLGYLNRGVKCGDGNKKTYKSKGGVIKYAYWHKRIKKWQATIKIDGKFKFLGYHDTEEKARNIVLAFLLENKILPLE